MPGDIDADKALQTAREQFRALYDKSPLPIYVWRRTGADFRLTDYNEAAVRATRGGIHELLGITAREMFADRPEIVSIMADCLSRQTGVETETAYRMRTTGEQRHLAVTAVYMPPDQVLVHTQDVTPQRQVERELRATEQDLRRNRDLLLALSQAAGAIHQAPTSEQVFRVVYDEIQKLGYHAFVLAFAPDRSYLTVDHLTWRPAVLRATERLARLRASEARIPLAPDGFFRPLIADGRSLFCEQTSDLIARGLPGLGRAALARLVEILGVKQTLYAPLRHDGDLHAMLCVAGTDLTEAFLPAITAFANQITIALENIQLRERIEASQHELRQLTRQLMAAQEVERRRIALTLHDEVGQVLTRLRLGLDLIGESLPDGLEPLRQRLDRAAEEVGSVGEVIRSASRGLHPPLLDLVGLGVALQEVCRTIQSTTGLSVRYSGPEDAQAPDDVSIALYRVLQESLTNAAKHAHASEVRVELTQDQDCLYLTIQDDGLGFDVQELLEPRPGDPRDSLLPHGLGFPAMRERLEGLDGKLDVRSQPGKGTLLVATVPRSGPAAAGRG